VSSGQFDQVIIDRVIVRDFYFPWTAAANFVIDTALAALALGTDLIITNRGAAALTIAINGQGPITVDAGAVFGINSQKIWLVNIVSAVLYDFQISGLRMSTLMKLGMMPS